MRDFAKFPSEDWLRQRASELALAMALGLAFAWIGPFSTDKAEFLPKLGYWVGLLACWYIVAALVEHALERLPAFRDARRSVRRPLICAVAVLPMLPVAALATVALSDFEPTFWELAEMSSQIFVVGWGVMLLTDAILRPAGPPDPQLRFVAAGAGEAAATIDLPAGESEAPQTSRLVERLPPNLRGPLICLRMEDHYVRVHTTRGSTLILMRLGDAMAEAAPTPGAQSHRSWWVAANAVESFERVGRVGQLRLKTGLTAPVSQPYLQAIEALAAKP
ncbi:LytTR family DNA-binding domain-containing protein [Chenggangzhangella methanolivorans]|uniref:LytTR family transcriptional regulator n=1 Tax=Chenggangzhangella methanolivorans TaxID=1437009 RepID=A0A9E6R6K6_9HYPH|nr:LytTR family DNA-binding domain-containing protein [Chenggangzhangella methanolivorans]QZN98244.1 LytTR family transcriptional regulator [Chenggangzhangella methanolivorans]